MVWGRVLGRFGDVFGPTVNLASRLSALAAPGEVLIDSSTAKALEDESEFEILPGEPTQAPGLGWVHPHQLVRADTT
jgi:adenylate cyclase